MSHNQEITKEEFEKEFLQMYREGLALTEEALKKEEQIDCPIEDRFTEGLYLRTIKMPKGAFIIGKTHKTEHFNIVLSGSASVMINGQINFIEAPFIFVSKAGDKKVLMIHEEMLWATTHVTESTNVDEIEKDTVCKDQKEEKEFLQHLELKQIEEV